MSNEPNVLYTAEATVTGGREGHARTRALRRGLCRLLPVGATADVTVSHPGFDGDY